ncbi:MAG: FecR domain-containing protein [Planctomycetes bacterium]|nr:FecR domain-containing protein [Planctomycetota bacterium]
MRPAEAIQLIEAFSRQELSDEAAGQLLAELEANPALAEQVLAELAFIDHLSLASCDRSPDDLHRGIMGSLRARRDGRQFAHRVRQTIHRRKRQKRRNPPLTFLATAACAAGLIIGFTIIMGLHKQNPSSSEPPRIAEQPTPAPSHSTPIQGQDTVGRIVMTGDLLVDGRAAQLHQNIAPGANITVPAGGQEGRFAWAERGISVTVSPGTIMTMPEQAWGTDMRYGLAHGNMYIDYTRQSPDHRLEITTQDAEVTVVGTIFQVLVDDFGTMVATTEGQVRVEPVSNGDGAMVRAGEELRVPRQRPLNKYSLITIDSEGEFVEQQALRQGMRLRRGRDWNYHFIPPVQIRAVRFYINGFQTGDGPFERTPPYSLLGDHGRGDHRPSKKTRPIHPGRHNVRIEIFDDHGQIMDKLNLTVHFY